MDHLRTFASDSRDIAIPLLDVCGDIEMVEASTEISRISGVRVHAVEHVYPDSTKYNLFHRFPLVMHDIT